MFIIWPIDIDESFRNRYETIVGEEIQISPIINNAHDLYMVGSARITGEQASILQEEFTESCFCDEVPEWWSFGVLRRNKWNF